MIGKRKRRKSHKAEPTLKSSQVGGEAKSKDCPCVEPTLGRILSAVPP